MGRDDPFQGIHFSEQVKPSPLDQRLFGDTSVPTVTPVMPPATVATAPTVPIPEAKLTTAGPATAKPVVVKSARFNLNDDARYKASYNYTNDELLAIEELRLELSRTLDKKVTKNDLMRSAVHLLLEDHEANGARSYAIRKIRKRTI